MKIYIAPVQGHTDAAWRNFHHEMYGGDFVYFTPFIRLEKGELRKRDRNDALSPLNEKTTLIPQVIFRDYEELSRLVALLKEDGVTSIDINMGCPFPLQTARGRGAATIARPEAAEAVRRVVEENPEISFSVKMRLGMSDRNEWRPLLEVLNTLPLSHITLHPRVARQQYGGEVDLAAFSEFLEASRHPVVYNGDLRTPAEIAEIAERFPSIEGIMLGRGLLGRPSLATEFAEGAEWSESRRLDQMKKFHNRLFSHYSSTLEGGDHQILSKIVPFWEYAESEIGRKAWKAVKKSGNMAKYHSALAQIG